MSFIPINLSQILFVYVYKLITRTNDLHLKHTVYRKPTHTDRYLHKTSNHHPRQKFGVIKTLVERAKRICEPEQLGKELHYLTNVMQANGYSKKEIHRASNPRRQQNKRNEEDKPLATAYMPYFHRITDRIGKLLKKYRIRTIYIPTKKIKDILRPAKDKFHPHKKAGVYRIPCSCGQVYIGTTKRSIATRLKEHDRNSRLGQIEKSAVAEHAALEGHTIQYDNTEVLSTALHYYPRLQREAIEIFKHPNNFNKKEETQRVNRIWIPVLKKTKRKHSMTSSNNTESLSDLGSTSDMI